MRLFLSLVRAFISSGQGSWSGVMVAVRMIHTPLAGDSMRTCLPANSLPKEICPLAPMDLTILLSVAGLDIALSL